MKSWRKISFTKSASYILRASKAADIFLTIADTETINAHRKRLDDRLMQVTANDKKTYRKLTNWLDANAFFRQAYTFSLHRLSATFLSQKQVRKNEL